MVNEKDRKTKYHNDLIFSAKIRRNSLSNPDLPINFIAQLLIAKDLPNEPFTFEGNNSNHAR